MKHTLSMNILRVSLLLVILGFFLPVACDLNGRQIAQGILGEPQQSGSAGLFRVIKDSYGYFLFAVFGCAAIGMLLTFIPRLKYRYFSGLAFMAASFVLFAVVVLKFLAIRDGVVLGFVITTFNLSIKILVGGYSIAAGYLLALISLVSRRRKRS